MNSSQRGDIMIRRGMVLPKNLIFSWDVSPNVGCGGVVMYVGTVRSFWGTWGHVFRKKFPNPVDACEHAKKIVKKFTHSHRK